MFCLKNLEKKENVQQKETLQIVFAIVHDGLIGKAVHLQNLNFLMVNAYKRESSSEYTTESFHMDKQCF